LKDFYTYEQQINKLKENGLIIENEAKVLEILKLEGYYNIINGYSCMFKGNNEKYLKNTTFENIVSLYNFDRNLQPIIYKYALKIECHIKALIAHEFSKNHGVDEKKYLSKDCFTKNANNIQQVEDLIKVCKKVINEGIDQKNIRYRKYIEHNYIKHGHVPLWILIRALTFGTTSIFYKNMNSKEKQELANYYLLTEDELGNMLEMLVQYRNIVAHGERIFCVKLNRVRLTDQLLVMKKMSIPYNKSGNALYGRNDLLALLIIFKYLLPESEFIGFLYEIINEVGILEKNIDPIVIGKIKKDTGLCIGSWKVLHKINKI